MNRAHPFEVARLAIAGDEKHPGAVELRLVPPREGESPRAGTDLQGRFENNTGSYWLTLVTFPESPGFRSWVPPGPFGLRGEGEWR